MRECSPFLKSTKEVFSVQGACTRHSPINLPNMTHRQALRITPNESSTPSLSATWGRDE